MNTRAKSVLLVLVVASTALMQGRDANAFLRRQSAMSCRFDPSTTFDANKHWAVAGIRLRWENSGDLNAGVLFCSLLDDDSVPINNLAWISVQGYDASNATTVGIVTELSATPCITYESGTSGGQCGNAAVQGNGYEGVVDFALDLAVFDNKGTFDFPYVKIEVPRGNAGVSSFWGINWSS